jgi:hypothetical protein
VVQKEWAMLERVHVGNDEDFLLEHKHHKIQQTPSHIPKLWPPIISKNQLNGLLKSKMAYN